MRELETGRMSQYILTLIPDKQCSDIHKHKVKENFFSFSDKNGFSGIAIHTIPQLGIPVSIAQYFNGVIVRSVMMVADSEEGMIDNAKKAFEILGPMKIKSKNRLMTRSSGCDSNGSYGDGDEWKISGYERLSNGLFWDGTNYWYDSDGDGIPDSIILDEVVVEGEYTGGGGGNELVNPGSGYGGGENEGGGSSGSSGSNDSSEISDSDAYALGLSVFIDMDKEIKNGNITTRGLNLSTLAHYSTPLSYASNVQGLWASWLETVDTSVLTQKFGKGLAKAGFVLGMPQAISTIAVLIEGNTENLTMSDIMGLVSTALSGFVAFGVITGTAGAIVGFSAAVIGVASIFVNENNQYLPSQIELDNGITITILYA